MSKANYKTGSRWRVLKSGARLSGWQPYRGFPGASEGWGRSLTIGEIIEVANGDGWTPGDGVPAILWVGEGSAYAVTFNPVQGGMWGGQIPEDGFLEPV